MSVRPDPRMAVLAVGRRGVQIAERLCRSFGGDMFVPERWLPIAGARARAFPEGGIRAAVAEAFRAQRDLVLVVPLGVAVRLVAPFVEDKRTDPAVVVIDEAGAHAIALLSGHLGGANQLARDVAAALGAQPIVTTAAEVLGTPALDLLGREWGWTIEEGSALTRASAALIGGEPVGAYQDAGEEAWWRDAPSHLVRYSSVDALLAAPLAARVVVSDRTLPQFDLSATCVVFRPRSLVVGVGCVRGVGTDELDELIATALANEGLTPMSVRELATIDLKREEPGLNEVAARHGWSVRYFTAAELATVPAPSGRSMAVERAVGTPSVCEPAALLAAGVNELLVPKLKTSRATVAIARVSATVRGHLAIVGLGPGGRADLTERARHALEAADAVVGYHGYLDLVRPWLGPKAYHSSAIGDEQERCRLALALMRAGQRVALVSSGDAGIYGMAGLLFELIEEPSAPASALEIEVIPGVSAAQAAAALLGAPLMSDFATISLSDLLTPWATIEARINAAAAADLVVALYNPASNRRRAQLARAREILLSHRALTTPVGIVRNASRPGEEVVITDLDHLPEHAIDMLTIVIVGNSATVRIGDRITTRRGYLTQSEA